MSADPRQVRPDEIDEAARFLARSCGLTLPEEVFEHNPDDEHDEESERALERALDFDPELEPNVRTAGEWAMQALPEYRGARAKHDSRGPIERLLRQIDQYACLMACTAAVASYDLERADIPEEGRRRLATHLDQIGGAAFRARTATDLIVLQADEWKLP